MLHCHREKDRERESIITTERERDYNRERDIYYNRERERDITTDEQKLCS